MGVFRVFPLLALGVIAGPGLAGCDKKTRECNLVIDEVNQVEAKVKGDAPADAKAHAAALRKIADAETATVAELAKLHPTAPELSALSTKFQAAFDANAKASRDLADVDDRAPDPVAQQALIDRIGASREAIDAAEQRLALRCGDDAAACTPFAAALKKHPDPDALDTDDAVKTKAWADAVNAWSADVAKIEIKDAELKDQLDKLQKGYKDLASVIVDVGKISVDRGKRDVARAALAASAKDVASITDELNKYCQSP